MKNILLLFAIVLFLTGCGVTIETVKDKNFNEKLTDVYALINFPQDFYDLGCDLLSNFKHKFDSLGVSFNGYVTHPMDLTSEKEIVDRINNSNSMFLFLVRMTKVYGRNFGASKLEFEVVLYYKTNKQQVWKAVVEIKNQFNIHSTKGAVEELFIRLNKDNLILNKEQK